MDLDLSNISIKALSDENVAAVHSFCEENTDHWSQPLEFFRLSALHDSQFDSELSLVAHDENEQIIGFYFGSTRRDMNLKTKLNLLKFFVIDWHYRRQGLGTYMLDLLYQRFRSRRHKGRIIVFAGPPDYWFAGMNPKFTAAFFWLQKMGYKKSRIFRYRQNLYVDFNNQNSQIDFDEEPPRNKNGIKFQRVTPELFQKTQEFVKANFSHTWSEEVGLSYKMTPPTTYIAIEEKNEAILGFATFNAHFDGSFGPTGVLKTKRGMGIGGILLKWTLHDLKQSGHDGCQILWVSGNTVKYYSKVAGAYIFQILFPMHSKIK